MPRRLSLALPLMTFALCRPCPVSAAPDVRYEDVVGFVRTAWNLDSFSFVYEGSLELVGQRIARRIADSRGPTFTGLTVPPTLMFTRIFRKQSATRPTTHTLLERQP